MTSWRTWLVGSVSGVYLLAAGSLVTDVRALMAQNQFAAAEKLVAQRRAADAPVDVAEALSWLGRGALTARNYQTAARYAAEARKLALAELQSRKLDDEPHLPLALGASIEVQAQTMAAQGARSEAVEFLRKELKTWGATSIAERIQKNVNLLSLEGKPAPAIEAATWLGGGRRSLAALRGRPVLLFLWAHWCGECKGMAAPLAGLRQRYAARGLEVIGPTKLYGYAAGGMDATPAQELPYIDQVRQKFYADLAGMPVPVSESIFRTYGVSTTPTLVLIDRAGVVRLYHPGTMPIADLAARIETVM